MVHIVCFHEKNSLKCTWIYAAEVKRKWHFQDKKRSGWISVLKGESRHTFTDYIGNLDDNKHGHAMIKMTMTWYFFGEQQIFSTKFRDWNITDLIWNIYYQLFACWVRAQFFGSLPPGALGRDLKVKYHKISITKSISKIYKPNFVCLLTNERYKTNQTGFSFGRLGHAPRVGLGGTVGGWGVSTNFFQKIQPDLVCEVLTWMAHARAQFFGSLPPRALGRGQKVKYH